MYIYNKYEKLKSRGERERTYSSFVKGNTRDSKHEIECNEEFNP